MAATWPRQPRPSRLPPARCRPPCASAADLRTPPTRFPMKTSAFDSRVWLLGVLLPVAAHAVTATGLGSFEGIEEPVVRFTPSTGAFHPDAFVNITDLGEGT